MKSVRALVKERDLRQWALIAVIIIAGIFIVAAFVHAQDAAVQSAGPTAQAAAKPGGGGAAAKGNLAVLGDWIITQAGRFMGFLIKTMGQLILLLVNVLIVVAQYNDFVRSEPVRVGWTLIRDVVNMFFIVILLISAFSTIIGKPKDFYYKAVLPKLLVMAILINFSKTLVGLMIDFSQVVMLTFVSAFKAAAGGNFLRALKLTQLTSIKPDEYGTSKGADLAELMGAAILAVLMLGATLTLIIIMTLFLIFRIVGLWMLLILSPFAFFALALPGKLANSLSAFTNDWWKKLGIFLTGGPVMAFFLWLTLAVVQGSEQPFGSVIASAGSGQEVDQITKAAEFITKIGTGSNIATYLVAYVMMMQGVAFALSQAGAIGGGLASAAGIAAAGGGLLGRAARAAGRVGRTGVSVARYGVGKAGQAAAWTGKQAFELADKRLDIRGEIGRAGMAMTRGLPGAPGFERFAGLAGHARRETRAKEARMAEMTKDLTPEEQMKFYEAQEKASFDPRTVRAAKMRQGQLAASRGGQELLKRRAEERFAWIQDPEERKVKAEAYAMADAAKLIEADRAEAIKAGDDKRVEEIDEKRKKDPRLYTKYEDFQKIQSSGDFKKDLASTSPDAWKDSRTNAVWADRLGYIKDGKVDWEHKALKYAKQAGGDRWRYMEAYLKEAEQRPQMYEAQVKAMKEGATQADLDNAWANYSYVSKDNVGNARLEFIQSGQTAVGMMRPSAAMAAGVGGAESAAMLAAASAAAETAGGEPVPAARPAGAPPLPPPGAVPRRARPSAAEAFEELAGATPTSTPPPPAPARPAGATTVDPKVAAAVAGSSDVRIASPAEESESIREEQRRRVRDVFQRQFDAAAQKSLALMDEVERFEALDTYSPTEINRMRQIENELRNEREKMAAMYEEHYGESFGRDNDWDQTLDRIRRVMNNARIERRG